MEKALHEEGTASAVGLSWQEGEIPSFPQDWAPIPCPPDSYPALLSEPLRAEQAWGHESPTVAREMRILLKWPDVSELRASSRDL